MSSNKGKRKLMKILKKKNIPWNAVTLAKKMKDGTVVVESVSQRGLVWEKERKIDFIDSLIHGVVTGAITCNKKGNIFSILEGQQRSEAITIFLDDKLTLEGLLPVTMDDGTEIDVNGKLFSELPEVLQKIIKNASLLVYYYEDLTPAEEAFIIRKENNGKPMTSIERALIGSVSFSTYKYFKSHELMNIVLSEKAVNGSVFAEIVAKTWILLYTKEPSFGKSVFEPIVRDTVITEEQKNEIEEIYDYLVNVYHILIDDKENKKLSKRVARLLKKKLHLLSVILVAKKAIENEISDEQFSAWLKEFFNSEEGEASISDRYNENAKTGTAHAASVRARLEAVEAHWDKFFSY